jgi:hypothetical protein
MVYLALKLGYLDKHKRCKVRVLVCQVSVQHSLGMVWQVQQGNN